MIWLAVILLIAGLSFVIFHKPQLNVMGAGWQPPHIDPPAPRDVSVGANAASSLAGSSDVEEAVTLRLRRSEATGGWSAEDAVTTPMGRPVPAVAAEESAAASGVSEDGAAVETAPVPFAEDARPAAPAATMPDTFDFNDLLVAKAGPAERPTA